jgi:hypothetical protein
MKKIKLIVVGLAVLVIILTYTSRASAAIHDGLSTVPAKYKNLFVFKADRKYVGAKVEVLTSTGAVVTTQTLEKRKMIIDFCDVKSGSYTIRVSKGHNVQEFQYDKKP